MRQFLVIMWAIAGFIWVFSSVPIATGCLAVAIIISAL